MRRKLLARRYVLLEEIGSGGMGTVYRARDRRSKSEVAVKILHPYLRRERSYLQRFRREAEIVQALKSLSVVRVLDVGHEGDDHFLVMEFVQGRNLKEVILESGRLNAQPAMRIALDIAAALEEAHARGIVHRDIKPQNVLVTSDGNAKVTDFGIARASELPELTSTGGLVGSVHYMAPEALAGRAEARSDIYSLGAVLYEMLSGGAPFPGQSPYEVIKAQMEQAPSSLPAILLGPELTALVLACLAKEPDERPRSANEVVMSLSALLEQAQWAKESADKRKMLPTRSSPSATALESGLPLDRAATPEADPKPVARLGRSRLPLAKMRLLVPLTIGLLIVGVVGIPFLRSGRSTRSDATQSTNSTESQYIVQAGDTIGGICTKATLPVGMSIAQCLTAIQSLNHLAETPLVGQRLIVPGGYYVVVNFDTLSGICSGKIRLPNGMTPDECVAAIKAQNYMGSGLTVGQVVQIPGQVSGALAPGRPSATDAAGASALQTQVITFTPLGRPSIRIDGDCSTASEYVHRPEAWRCIAGTTILDPCFGAISAQEVICVLDPTQAEEAFLMRLSAPLPVSYAWSAPDGHVWAVLTVDGVACVYMSGASAVINGARVNYSCSDGSTVIGDPLRGTVWTARQLRPTSPGSTVLTETQVALRTVWQ